MTRNRHQNALLWMMALAVVFLFVHCKGSGPKAELPQDSKDKSAAEDYTAVVPAPAVDQDLVENVGLIIEEARRKRHTYKIGADDLMKLTVWQREDLAKEGVVKDDGTFFVPLAGNVPIAGLSVSEAQALIRERLLQYIRDPQVDLDIKEYRSQVFFANGQFRNPGSYPIKGTTSVLEGIGAAGGVTDEGNLSGAYLVREGKVIPVDFISLFTKGQMAQNLPLADGDLIYVPSINTSRVFVLGEVLRPAGVPVRTGKIALTQAITDAGGFNEATANKRGIKIVRGGLGSGNVISVNYDDVIKGKRLDLVMLQPGDIVYVPATGLAKWDRALSLILPNLSRIVVDAAAVDSLTK